MKTLKKIFFAVLILILMASLPDNISTMFSWLFVRIIIVLTLLLAVLLVLIFKFGKMDAPVHEGIGTICEYE